MIDGKMLVIKKMIKFEVRGFVHSDIVTGYFKLK